MKLVQHRALKEVQNASGDSDYKLQELQKRHQHELKMLKEKAAIEKDELKAFLLKQQQDSQMEF